MMNLHGLELNPPILNSSSFWASSRLQLEDLYASKWTGGVTTRTATILGFPEDTVSVHQHAFLEGVDSSINSYGYSPIPLSQYLEWIKEILCADPGNKKPFIISIAPASTRELTEMLNMIQSLRKDVGLLPSRIGIELNTSCPNIPGHPPPAYNPEALKPLLQVCQIGFSKDSTLTIGLKLAPLVHAGQFRSIVDLLASISTVNHDGKKENCISFLSCTNTLGSNLVFGEQTTTPRSAYALPTALGGLAGEFIHTLSLGNVYSFRSLLSEHSDESLQKMAIIGIGGVNSGEAVARMIRAGAGAVACATALGIHGIGIFEELNKGL